MNKKGGFWYMVGLILSITLIIFGALYLLDKIGQPNRDSCKSLCTEYDAIFIEYEASFFSSAECWCKTKLNEPLRVK